MTIPTTPETVVQAITSGNRDQVLATMTTHQKHRYDAHRAIVRQLDWLGLDREIDSLWAVFSDDATDPDSYVVRYGCFLPLVTAAVDEHVRRKSRPNPIGRDDRSAKLSELAKIVKDSVTVEQLMRDEAPHLTIIPGKRESHSPCPVCGGHDRFILKNETPSWGYCRKCGFAPDVIGLAAYFWNLDLTRADAFRETVIRLAERYAGGARGVS